jgi:putative MFS transporter
MILEQDVGRNTGARLDAMPIGSFHRRLLALIGAGLALDGFELYLTGGVLSALTRSGWSTMALNAAFVTATFAGMTIGAWTAGILGDHLGRKFAYQFNLMLFGMASIVATFAPNMQLLIALRFVMGLGLGAEVVVGYAMLAEFVPAHARGRMIGWLAVITNTALIVATCLGLWIIPSFGWRYMFLIVGVGAVIVWLLRFSMPESPRWLEAKGRFAEAEAVLHSVGAKPLVGQGVEAPVANPSTVTVWDLFKPPVLWRTLMGILINVVTGFCLYGFINWLPTFFVKRGVEISSSLLWTMVMALGAPVGAIIGLVLSDRIGRKPVIVLGSLWAALFGAIFPFMGDGYALMIVGFLLFVGIYVLLAVAFALHVPELFRTEYRLRGVGICSTSGRISTAAVQFVVVALFSWKGVSGVVGLLVALLLLQAIVFLTWGIETRSRSLEDTGALSDLEDEGLSSPHGKTAI